MASSLPVQIDARPNIAITSSANGVSSSSFYLLGCPILPTPLISAGVILMSQTSLFCLSAKKITRPIFAT